MTLTPGDAPGTDPGELTPGSTVFHVSRMVAVVLLIGPLFRMSAR
jgi:hypothetical protein